MLAAVPPQTQPRTLPDVPLEVRISGLPTPYTLNPTPYTIHLKLWTFTPKS